MTRAKGSTKLVARAKAARALELAMAGATYNQIAKEVGYSHPQGAFRVVKKELQIRRMSEQNIEDLRTLQLERLNRMMLIHWPGVQRGDLESTKLSLEIMRRIDLYAGNNGMGYRFSDDAPAGGVSVTSGSGTVFVIGGAPKEYIGELNKMAQELGLAPAGDLSHLDTSTESYEAIELKKLVVPGMNGAPHLHEQMKQDIQNQQNGQNGHQNGKPGSQAAIDAESFDSDPLRGPQNAPEGHEDIIVAPSAMDTGKCLTGFIRIVTGEDKCVTCGRKKQEHE
jgi:hypothetical protein